MAKTALVVTTVASQVDAGSFGSLTGINITAYEPAGTAIRYAVRMDGGTWKKWNTSTTAWVDLATQVITGTSVIAEGNTEAEMEAIPSTGLSVLLGKKIDIANARQIISGTVSPKVTSIDFNGKTGTVQTKKTIASDVIQLSASNAAVDILSIDIEKAEASSGTVTVYASLQSAGGDWGAFQPVANVITSPATAARAIKFTADLIAPTPGTSQAKLTSIAVKHRTDNIAVFAEGTGVCITKTFSFENVETSAHLMVKHPIVKDTEFAAELSLRAEPVTETGEILGVGDGTQKTYKLKNPTKVASHGFALYFDEKKQTAGYSFSPTDGAVTCIVPTGQVGTVDYIHEWEEEAFVPMVHDAVYAAETGLVNDQFNYNWQKDGDPKGAIGNLKITIAQNKGSAPAEVLGTANGVLQAFTLAHNAKPETISILPATATWTYKEKTNAIFVTAPDGQEITAAYDWAAKANYIESLACIWNK